MRGGTCGLSLVSILAFVVCFKLCFGFCELRGYVRGHCGLRPPQHLLRPLRRVGGVIYTKAADVGTDLSGKNDYGLHDDDYRNKDLGSLAASSSSASSAKAVAS